jgi:hypothetical protein
MSATLTAKKRPRGRPSQPGNPGAPGRPAGSRNQATLALDLMAEVEGRIVLRKLLDAAKGGDLRAIEASSASGRSEKDGPYRSTSRRYRRSRIFPPASAASRRPWPVARSRRRKRPRGRGPA